MSWCAFSTGVVVGFFTGVFVISARDAYKREKEMMK